MYKTTHAQQTVQMYLPDEANIKISHAHTAGHKAIMHACSIADLNRLLGQVGIIRLQSPYATTML